MIHKASHNLFLYPFFKIYTLWKIRRNFHRVYITGNYVEKELPVMLISNHFSWWDGFWAMYLNMKILHRKFYFMMLEDQLEKNMFFNKTGGYSIRKGSRTIVESLDYTASLLENNRNVVLIFPQGKIESVYNRNIKFEKGTEYILRKLAGKIQILFLVNLVDYFSNPRPGLYIYFRECRGTDFTTEALNREFNDFYMECIDKNIKKNED